MCSGSRSPNALRLGDSLRSIADTQFAINLAVVPADGIVN
jgi:hypothetical protein